MEFIDIVKKRHAAKKFNGGTVSQEKIDQLLEMIRFAPSSIGLQQFKVKVVTDQETKEKLQAVTFNQEQISTCSHLLVFCAYTDFDARAKQYQELMRAQDVSQEKIDGFVNMTSGYLKMVADDNRIPWATRQAFIALDHAMLGATSLGLDTCPMEGFIPQKYSEILGLSDDLVPVVLCPVGFSADEVRTKIRFPKDDLFF